MTVYAIYFFIYTVFWITGEGFFNGFFLLFQQVGNAIAIFSTISLLEKQKFKLKFFRWIVLSYYFFFTLVSSLMIGFAAFNGLSVDDPCSILSLIDILGFSLPIVALYSVVKTFTDFNFNRLPKILWFGYLWMVMALMSLFLVSQVLEISKWKIYDYFLFVSAILSILTIISYIFKREFFNQMFWEIYFWTNIIWGLLDISYYLGLRYYIERPEYLKSFAPEGDLSVWFYFWGFIILSPTYYAFYKIAFDKKYFKKS